MSERTFYERAEEIRGFRFIRLKSGRMLSFWDAIREADSAHTSFARAISRAFKTAKDDYDLEWLERHIEDTEDYVAHVRAEIEKRRGVKTVEDRIALLRNTSGRTPEEAETFHRKADELEQRIRSGR